MAPRRRTPAAAADVAAAVVVAAAVAAAVAYRSCSRRMKALQHTDRALQAAAAIADERV